MRLLIAFNATEDGSDDDDPDLISETAVKDEAQAVYEAARKLGMHADLFPVFELTDAFSIVRETQPDVIFNLCEGFHGFAQHEMYMAAFWELLGIPYTGNSPLTLGLAQDKVLTKRLLESGKINTPPYQVFTEIHDNVLLDFPLIVKPSCEDASLGISAHAVVQSVRELQHVVGILLKKYNQPILAEKYIPGREFNISIMNNPPKVLAISEIDFSALSNHEAHIASYEAKWMPDHPLYQKTPAQCPANLSSELKRRLEHTAIQVYTQLRGRDYGRVDIRVDSEEQIYVLEYNPNPDISPDAGFSKAIRAYGLTYQEFVNIMIKNALHRKQYDQIKTISG